jgi:hypothetical protein
MMTTTRELLRRRGPRRPTGRARPALALLVLLLAGCEKNVADTPLAPSGTRPVPTTGVLTGRVDFGTGTFPATLVLAARVKQPSFQSPNSSIRVTGTNTDPIFNVPASPSLTQLSPGVWVDTLRLKAGPFEWKFVTNEQFDNPSDYSTLDPSRVDGLENDLGVSSPGSANLRAVVPADWAGQVLVCVLDETPLVAHYRFGKVPDAAAVFSSTTDGSFALSGLEPGRYNVLIRPAGQPPVTRADVIVNESGSSDLGTIQFGSGNPGRIRGTLKFDDPANFPPYDDLASPPYPPTVVELYQGTFKVAADTTTGSDRSFDFPSLAAGTYRIEADARMFARAIVNNIDVGTATVDLGDVQLAADITELTTSMHVAGDWNGFTIDPTTQMNLTANVTWTYTTTTPITAGIQNMKFVTDGSFDNPTDYGGDESVTLTVPLANAPARLVSGFGTALHLDFTANADYTFTLDERRQTFTIELAAASARLHGRRPWLEARRRR